MTGDFWRVKYEKGCLNLRKLEDLGRGKVCFWKGEGMFLEEGEENLEK